MMKTINIVSVSGGKDSTATILLALEQGVENIQCVFADTGHEHASTYEYVDYLDSVLPVKIQRVRANFDRQIANKRHYLRAHWVGDIYENMVGEGFSDEEARRVAYMSMVEALQVLHSTGNPFLDLCLWKGRFPSTRRRFCSEELKHKPIQQQVIEPALAEYQRIVSWQGIRADESPSRAKLPMDEMDFGDAATGAGLWIHRPILHWTVDDVFAMHRKHGIKWNPLYEQGMGRVGCMPCIHAGKREMHEIALRFPDELARVSEWERLVSMAAKRGAPTFMDARTTAKMLGTGTSVSEINHTTHGIMAYVDWARTTRGGKQIDLIKAIEIDAAEEDGDAMMCSSIYGLCE